MEWEEKGIRGAGSVVRKAYSFGRHSRQPFVDPSLRCEGLLTSLRYRFERLLLRLFRVAPQARPTHPHRGCSGCPSARRYPTLETRPRLPSVSPGLGNETHVPRRWTTGRCFAGNTHKATPGSPWVQIPKRVAKSETPSSVSDKLRSHCRDPDSTAYWRKKNPCF